MIDLRRDLEPLKRNLALTPSEDGRGRIVLFMSARAGEGVSSIAASFALLAAETAQKPVWLIDLDLRRNAAFNAFAVGDFATQFGGVGPPYAASLKTQPFFAIDPASEATPEGLGAFTAHRIGDTRAMVTQFDAGRLKPFQSIKIRTAPAYWAAARAATDWTIIDAPALERASAGLAVCSQVDACVLVVRADATPPREVDALSRAIEEHGGRLSGAVLNRELSGARLVDRFFG